MAKAPITENMPPEGEQMVTIRLPLIPGVDKQEAQYVGVNDRSWVIPRGVTMEVPACVVEVLENAETEAIRAAEYRAKKAIKG